MSLLRIRVIEGFLFSAFPPLTPAFNFYLPYAVGNATILKRTSNLYLSQRENGLFANGSGIYLGASVDTCHYHSGACVRALLDLDEDSSRGEDYEQGKAMITA